MPRTAPSNAWTVDQPYRDVVRITLKQGICEAEIERAISRALLIGPPECLLVDAGHALQLCPGDVRFLLEAWATQAGGRPAVLLVDQQPLDEVSSVIAPLAQAGLLSAVCASPSQAAALAVGAGRLWHRQSRETPAVTAPRLQRGAPELAAPLEWRPAFLQGPAQVH